MRLFLTLTAVIFIFSASNVMGLGKSDGSKKKVDEPLAKKEVKPAAKKPAKPVVAPVKPAAKKPTKPVAPVTPPKVVTPKAAEPVVSPDKVVVTVNGIAIKEGAVQAKLDEAMKMQMSRMAGRGGSIPPDALKGLRDRMRKDVVDGIVLEQLIDEKIKAAKIVATDADVDAKIDEILTLNKITLDQAKEQLAANGTTFDDFKEQMKKNVEIEKVIDSEMKASGESSEVTEEDAKKFYDENAPQFSSPEQVRASHILIKADMKDEAAKAEAKKKIDGILEKARAGEDFAALAKEHSEDPGSKDKGGEYTFERGKMVKPFEDTAFSLEVGKISDPVETTFGYHIIKLSEKIPAKTTGFDEVKERLIKDLASRKMNQFWGTLRKTIQEDAKIEWSAEEKAAREKAAVGQATSPRVIQPKK